MNYNKLFEKIEDNYGENFDDVKKENIRHLSVDELFNTEIKLLKEIDIVKDESQNLDLLYLNYNNVKDHFNKKILDKKSKIIIINNNKELIDKSNLRKKNNYLKREYNFYLEQTNTKNYLNNIKLLHKKIEYLLNIYKSNIYNNRYSKIKNKYNNIIAFVKSENCETSKIDSSENILNQINFYNEKIENLIEKQMIFNNYIFLLESFYKDVVTNEIKKLNVNI